MTSRLRNWLGFLIRHPKLGLPAVLVLVLVAYLGWLGGCMLWVRWDSAEAKKALAEYDFAEARRRLDRCIEIRPRDAELRLLAAQTARRDGDPDAAEEQLDAHRNLVGELDPREFMERVLLVAQRGNLHVVIEQLIESLDVHHPQSEQILEALAMGSVQGYQLHRAMFWTNELMEKWPKNALGRLLRAQTIDTQGYRDKAIAVLQELVLEFPKYFKARLSLANMLFKSGRYRLSAVEYATLVQQRPEDLLPLLGLGSAYERLGAADEARPLLERLHERYPDNSEVLLECARLALGEKKPADAERLLRRAVKLAPTDHEIHRELGVCLERLGKHEESRQHLARCKQIEADLILLEKTLAEMGKAPNDPKPRRQAGEICLRNGQVSEGLRWLLGVLDIVPDDKPTQQILANFYASRADTEGAAFHGGRGY